MVVCFSILPNAGQKRKGSERVLEKEKFFSKEIGFLAERSEKGLPFFFYTYFDRKRIKRRKKFGGKTCKNFVTPQEPRFTADYKEFSSDYSLH